MNTKVKKTLEIIIITVACAAVIILVTCGFAAKNNRSGDKKWLLKTYGKNVALYYGSDVVTVYDTIEIETLPESDIKMLDNGIAFPTKEEALTTIEDYDS